MERLSGLDAGFLYMETPTLHMHTLKIAVVDPSTVPGGYTYEKVKEVLADHLHLLPSFRRRVVDVPFGIHHPVMIEDPDFDLDWHVRRVGVPRPGGLHELSELISDITSRQLDRTRPLWEIWVMEGLEHGHVGFVAKIHHTLADGVAAAAMLMNVMGVDPDAAVPQPAEPWRPDRVPGRVELLVGALASIWAVVLSVPGLVRRTVRGMRAVTRRRRSADVSPPMPFGGPKRNVPWGGALTPHRKFVMTSLSLDDVKRVRKAFGVTVNDVVLEVCASSLRRYLAAHGGIPDRALVAGVPVSIRPGDAPQLTGNQVSNMFTSLCTDVDDPVERLRRISEITKAAKEVHRALGSEMLAEWSELSPPRLFAGFMRLYSRLRLAERHRSPINLVVSNVPGPTEPLYIGGARLEAVYSMGPILEGIGLNITVWSYLGQMNFGIVACPEAMPDLWSVADGLHDALEELVKRAAETTASSS